MTDEVGPDVVESCEHAGAAGVWAGVELRVVFV
jgi:hypothetical protein